MINDLPTVFEVVTERKPIKDKPSVDSGSKSRVSTKVNRVSLKIIIINTKDLTLKKFPRRTADVVHATLFLCYFSNFLLCLG